MVLGPLNSGEQSPGFDDIKMFMKRVELAIKAIDMAFRQAPRGFLSLRVDLEPSRISREEFSTHLVQECRDAEWAFYLGWDAEWPMIHMNTILLRSIPST